MTNEILNKREIGYYGSMFWINILDKLQLGWFKLPVDVETLKSLKVDDVKVKEKDPPDCIIEATIFNLRPVLSKDLCSLRFRIPRAINAIYPCRGI